MIDDLPDDRREAKPWLPQDGFDVTHGLVIEGSLTFGCKPDCVDHGAMNRVDRYPHPTEKYYTYRCQMCGVGAKWWPMGDGPGEREALYQPDYFGRMGRVARNDEIEKLMIAWTKAEESDNDIDLDDLPGYRFELFHDVTIRVRWSDVYMYPDGVLDDKEYVDADPVAAAIDAMLEPRFDTDKTEVIEINHEIVVDPNAEPEDRG